MKQQQRNYRGRIIDIVRDIIWAQWNRLGLNGTGGANHHSVDIEASLIAAGYGARLDGRLYEGVWSWVTRYGPIVNAERLASLVREMNDEWISRFVGALLSNVNAMSWRGVIKTCERQCSNLWEATPLLVDSTGRSWRANDATLAKWGILYEKLQPGDKLQSHDNILLNNAVIRYRYLYGTVIRADVLYLLSIGDRQFLTSARLAELLCCHLSTIHRIRDELENGGFIESGQKGTWEVKNMTFLSKGKGLDAGTIDWIKMNALLGAAIGLAVQIDSCQNEVVLKSRVQDFQVKYFPLLQCKRTSGPLERYTVLELLKTITDALNDVYCMICSR